MWKKGRELSRDIFWGANIYVFTVLRCHDGGGGILALLMFQLRIYNSLSHGIFDLQTFGVYSNKVLRCGGGGIPLNVTALMPQTINIHNSHCEQSYVCSLRDMLIAPYLCKLAEINCQCIPTKL